MKPCIAGVVAILFCANQLAAQQRRTAQTAFRRDVAPSGTTAPQVGHLARGASVPHDGKMLAAGVMSGVVGLVAGAAIGYKAETLLDECECDVWFCGLAGALIGGTIGMSVMVPVGVHAVSGHASYGRQLGMSLLLAAGSVLAAPVTSGVSMLVMPVAQLVTSMTLEHRAAARSLRAQQ